MKDPRRQEALDLIETARHGGGIDFGAAEWGAAADKVARLAHEQRVADADLCRSEVARFERVLVRTFGAFKRAVWKWYFHKTQHPPLYLTDGVGQAFDRLLDQLAPDLEHDARRGRILDATNDYMKGRRRT